MADEAFELKPPKKPPDFTAADSKWLTVEKLSAHMYLTAPRVMVDYACKDLDPQMPSWVGYVNGYEKDGIGVGKEYSFFGKGSRLKYWGMKGDKDEDGKDKPLYHDLAILWSSNKWEIFSFAEYEVKTLAVFGQKTDVKKALSLRLALFRRNHNTKLAEVTINR